MQHTCLFVTSNSSLGLNNASCYYVCIHILLVSYIILLLHTKKDLLEQLPWNMEIEKQG